MKMPGDYCFELPEEIPGPTVILQGEKNEEAVKLAAALTLRYSDLKQETAEVFYGENNRGHKIQINISVLDNVDYYNVASDDF